MLECWASLGTILSHGSRLMCPGIFSSFSKMLRQTQAFGDILLLHSKWCNPQYRYLKKCKYQCVFQAIWLHHWVFWLCDCLEAISQLHSLCKWVYLLPKHESQWNETMGNHVLSVFKIKSKEGFLPFLFRYMNMENCSWMTFVLYIFYSGFSEEPKLLPQQFFLIWITTLKLLLMKWQSKFLAWC